jgi:glycosyltransferase 2 family protein
MQRWLGIALKVGITALILGLFVWQLDLRSAMRALSTISPYAIFAAAIAVLAVALAAAARLVLVVAGFGRRFGLSDSFRVTLESMFFSQTFISFLGGDALRIWRIRRLGLPLAKASSAVILDRLIGTLVNHAFVLASLPWFLSSNAGDPVKAILVVLAAAGVAGFALLVWLGYARGRIGILALLPARIRASAVAAFIIEAATLGRDLLSARRRLAWICALSALMTVTNMLTFALILSGMGVALPLALGCALLVPAIMEIAMLPISLAGWGLREGAAVVAFGALGLPADQALGASIAFGLTLAAVSMLGGILWLVDRREMTKISLDVSEDASVPPSSTR